MVKMDKKDKKIIIITPIIVFILVATFAPVIVKLINHEEISIDDINPINTIINSEGATGSTKLPLAVTGKYKDKYDNFNLTPEEVDEIVKKDKETVYTIEYINSNEEDKINFPKADCIDWDKVGMLFRECMYDELEDGSIANKRCTIRFNNNYKTNENYKSTMWLNMSDEERYGKRSNADKKAIEMEERLVANRAEYTNELRYLVDTQTNYTYETFEIWMLNDEFESNELEKGETGLDFYIWLDSISYEMKVAQNKEGQYRLVQIRKDGMVDSRSTGEGIQGGSGSR